jgi:predicted nucleic acid-binding protein
LHPLDSGKWSFDANSVVDFSRTTNLALLDQLFIGRALMSDFVVNELAAAHIEWKQAETIRLIPESELQLFADVRTNNPPLGVGEVGAITVARLYNAGLITNDRQARRAASELGIPVFGSLAILSYAAQAGTISGEEAVGILSEMILAGAWLSEELIESFRRDVLRK